MKKLIFNINTNKKTIPLILLGIIFLMILAEFVPPLSIFSQIALIVGFTALSVFLTFENTLCILLFTVCFKGIGGELSGFGWYNVLNVIVALIFSIKYLIEVRDKKNKIYKLPFILTIILCLYSCIRLNVNNISNLANNITLFILIYLCFLYRKDIKLRKLINYFFIGLLLSVIIGAIFLISSKTRYISYYASEGRFMACLSSPNPLQMLCVLAISMLIYLLYKNRINIYSFGFFSIVFTFAGLLTKSKAFIICLILLLLVFFIVIIKKYKKKGVYAFLAILGLLLIFSVIFRNLITEVIDRFFVYEYYENLFDRILTGRVSIWKSYLSKWSSSATSIIWGCGVTASETIGKGPHSTYIDLLFRYGIIGCLLIVALVISYYNIVKSKKARFKLINILPLFMFAFLALEECLLNSFRCIFVFVMLFVFDDEKEEKAEVKQTYLSSRLKFVKAKDLLSILKLAVAFIPAMIAKIFIRDFWLVCEDEFEARDNGYWFFKYVRENHPEQKIAYAINTKSVDYDKVKNLGKVVQFGSIKHWFWYLVADKNISSQKNGKPNPAVCYIIEVVLKLRNKNRYFLQHGITINDVEFLHYNNTMMYRFMVATHQEMYFINQHFGYPEGAVCLTGMCRYDGLYDAKVNKKQILIMPTWRQWIAKEVECEKIEGSKNFVETNYFKHWEKFLKSEKFDELLEKYDKEIIFYPHRNMQKYIDKFTTSSKRIKIANSKEYDVQALLKESALLITDYSSIYFDFAYMKKPIIFYQFDESQFRKYQYAEGYFDYHDNVLGIWCGTEEAVLYRLENLLKNDLVKENIDAIDEYFPNRDNKNCERNYQVVKYGKVISKKET